MTFAPAPSENQTSVLVTGASGFIGSHLAQLLVSSGYRVTNVDVRPPRVDPGRSGVPHLAVDITDRARLLAAFEEVQPRLVLHLAARTDLGGATVEDYPANVEGVANVLEAVATTESVTRTVCTSSQLVCRMGYTPEHDTDFAPSNAYGESKVLTEVTWREGDGGGKEWAIVRPTTIWGPHMNPHYLGFFRHLRAGRYFNIGGRPVPKSYGYVENTTDQFLRIANAPASQVHGATFYLADAPPIDLARWVDHFRVALGAPRVRTMPLWVARALARVGDGIAYFRPSFPFTTFRVGNLTTPSSVDLERTLAVCGTEPRVSVEEGVAATVPWIEDQLRTEE